MSNTPSSESKKPSGFKLFITAVGGLVAISHIGLLGYLIEREPESLSVPTINIPRGPYSSYKIKAGKDGYEIEYRANDPKQFLSLRDQCSLIKTKRDSLVVDLKGEMNIVEINILWMV